jgi:hypothetical protein
MALIRRASFKIREHTTLLPTSLLQIARPDSGLSARTIADEGGEGYVFAAPAQRDPECGRKATARERFAPLWTHAT